LEEKILRRMTQLGFTAEDNGIYRFLAPMHRFLDVCLSVQQDRDLAASLHSALPLPVPMLAGDDTDDGDDISDEQALALAIAQERQELDA
ncbi:MAG: chromosome partitioning protein, partial [Proteobacteria bacterium]